ncbi:MAG TPA: magnesium transporter MgtC [Rhodospirillaceae bacterium]|nr:magnesium transporter MgtC [Rhodospirillaceae bacterium]
MPDLIIVADAGFALLLGFLFGYERSYRGRAAGMRTYGIVCMVAAALTSSSVHFSYTMLEEVTKNGIFIDPTRTIQGIVTGIGFLGAGIIMKDGIKISGLTTSASIWASAAIGILVGLGYYFSAFAVTLLAELFILLGAHFDSLLPARRPIHVSLQFQKSVRPNAEMVRALARTNGYEVSRNSIAVSSKEGQIKWSFVAAAINRRKHIAITDLADALANIEGLENFHLSRTRN